MRLTLYFLLSCFVFCASLSQAQQQSMQSVIDSLHELKAKMPPKEQVAELRAELKPKKEVEKRWGRDIENFFKEMDKRESVQNGGKETDVKVSPQDVEMAIALHNNNLGAILDVFSTYGRWGRRYGHAACTHQVEGATQLTLMESKKWIAQMAAMPLTDTVKRANAKSFLMGVNNPVGVSSRGAKLQLLEIISVCLGGGAEQDPRVVQGKTPTVIIGESDQ